MDNELHHQLIYNICGIRRFAEKEPSVVDVFFMVTTGLVT
jgi:hypothetical protein